MSKRRRSNTVGQLTARLVLLHLSSDDHRSRHERRAGILPDAWESETRTSNQKKINHDAVLRREQTDRKINTRVTFLTHFT